MADPFLKWAGSKRKLLPTLRTLLPTDIASRRYVEPFLGGGALFFDLQPQNAFLTDANCDLMLTYFAVRNFSDLVLKELRILRERHNEMHYYRVRDAYNGTARPMRHHDHVPVAQRAAWFIYLNKTGFNGLYRVNKDGKFNVPWGKYDQPTIYDAVTLFEAQEALNASDIALGLGGFKCWELEEYAAPGDFIYLDPPYLPVSDSANFTSYTDEGFGMRDHVRLAALFVTLDKRGCKLMLSNCAHPDIVALYSGYDVKKVEVARSINSDGAGRGVVGEIIVRNY